MKKILWLILVLTALGATAYVYRAPLMSKASQLLHLKGSAESEKAVYYCPMHPTQTSDRPGSCPICHMNLEKREPAVDKVARHAGNKHGDECCTIS